MVSGTVLAGEIMLGFLVITVLLTAASFVVALSRVRATATHGLPHATVLVLGDVGRSPRMQYHALSLAKHGCRVSLVGYPGAEPLEEVTKHPHIRIRHITSWSVPAGLPYSVRLVWLVLGLSAGLFSTLLWRTPRPRVILMQTPPAIPSMAAGVLAAFLQGAALVVDFHNFGYSLLALKLGDGHFLVRLHLLYEKLFGPLAHDAFCVTDAMREFLGTWRVPAVTLHDRPNSIFRPTPPEEQRTLFARLRAEGQLSELDDWWPVEGDADGGLFFASGSGYTGVAENRPRIVISSTSWTADEDFGQLLDALPVLDRTLVAGGSRAVVFITGRGDLKEAFEARYRSDMRQELRAIRVVTLWLSFGDYAALLGSADLGLSLHSSSSGLDLPMKVVDMFGAGLPVCARNFPALPELVQHGENGLIFNSTEELSSCLAIGMGVGVEAAKAIRKGTEERRLSGWDSHWDEVAWPRLVSRLGVAK
eukprot:TRINITY_DN5940_c0_g1_i2.p1 TRINITY_DN5940_c0_g1~~TRINITY_DN5940_c0_g1_i2.p1  ORF type:complete len:477 (-),score=61.12 TRINITY_DN5940_c0_g1_i2:150-1580(-)